MRKICPLYVALWLHGGSCSVSDSVVLVGKGYCFATQFNLPSVGKVAFENSHIRVTVLAKQYIIYLENNCFYA